MGLRPCARRILLAAIKTSLSLHRSLEVWLELTLSARAVARRDPPAAWNTSSTSFNATKEVPIPFVFLPLPLKKDFWTRKILDETATEGLAGASGCSVQAWLCAMPSLRSTSVPSCAWRPRSISSRISRAKRFRKRFSAVLQSAHVKNLTYTCVHMYCICVKLYVSYLQKNIRWHDRGGISFSFLGVGQADVVFSVSHRMLSCCERKRSADVASPDSLWTMRIALAVLLTYNATIMEYCCHQLCSCILLAFCPYD